MTIEQRARELISEKTFDEFWRELVIDEQGNLDPQKVKNELHDYHTFLTTSAEVYCHITGGQLSKPNYHAETITSAADAHYERLYEDTIIEERARLIAEIRERVGKARRIDQYNGYLVEHISWMDTEEILTELEGGK